MTELDVNCGLPIAEGAVVTVGTFDGVHRGHQDVLGTLVRHATARGLPSVVVTFEPHPLEIVNPSAAPPLLTLEETTRPLSVDRLEWEHIQRVLGENDGNISATARALGMHRRTLQRKLGKHAPRG